MKPISFCGLTAALAAGLLICPLARSQNALSGTTLGKSQNGPEDLFNSLVPGPKRFDKGEKKEEVDLKKLPSKTIHDKTFQGNLMDIGVDWTGEKMGKPVAAAESKTVKSTEADDEKDPKAAAKQSDAVGDKEKGSKEAEAAGDAKKQKAATVSSDEKSSDTNKPLANKTDGDH